MTQRKGATVELWDVVTGQAKLRHKLADSLVLLTVRVCQDRTLLAVVKDEDHSDLRLLAISTPRGTQKETP